MAKLHFSVSSDYKEVIRLRQECEKLEEQLKKMDVNKSPDVAKALEAQLGSATSQYKKLVEKIGEAEAKITKSADNIIKATDRIVQAQEKISKTNSTGSGSVSSVSSTETANIQAQAKAYDDLKHIIDDTLGSMEGNARFLAETGIRIKVINTNISVLEKTIKSQGHATSAQTEQLAKYNHELAELRIQSQDARRELNTGLRLELAGQGSIKALRNELLQMQRTYENMTESVRNSSFGREMAASIDLANKKVSELEQSMGRYNRNVGNYASGWNGLNMSIQQVGRELPSLAVGWNTFFLAISNNLPILADEIKRAKDEYKSLVAQGQKATPVWKQIVSSLFSWQTALTVGVTLLTVYGKDIMEWIKELVNGKEAVNALKEAQEKLNEAQLEGTKNAQSELIKLKLLRSLAEDESKQRSERLKAVSELQKMYPDYLGNIDKEKILAGQVSGIYNQLTSNIKNAAIARAKFDKAVSVAKEKDDLQEEFNTLIASSGKIRTRLGVDDIEQVKSKLKELKEIQGSTQGRYFGSTQRAADIKALQDISDAYDAVINKEKELESITKNIKIPDLMGKITEGSIAALEASISVKQNALKNVTNKKEYDRINAEIKAEQAKIEEITGEEAKKQADKRLKIQQKIADELLQLQATNQQREIDLMKEGTEKKVAQINFDYKKQIEAIKKQSEKWAKEQGGTLTAEQTIQISTAFANARKLREKNTTSIYKKEFEAAEKAMNDYLSKYGTYEEQRLAITKQYEEKIAKAITEGEKKTLQKEMENAISSIEFTKLKNDINWDSIFGNLSLYSSKKLKELRGQLRQLIETDKTLSMSDKTALIEQYNKLGDAIIKDQSALGKLFEHKTEQQKQIQLLKEEYELRKAIYDNLVKEQKIVKERYSGAKLNLEDFLEKNKFNTDTSSIDASKIISMLGVKGDSSSIDEFKYLFSMFNKAGNELSNVTSKVGEAGKSMQGASSALEGAGNSAASTISMIDMIIHGINDNIQSANELIKILEIEDTKFGEGFDSFAKSSQYATQAWESLKSGNIMGVAAGVAGSIKELGNAIGSWFGLSADYSSYNKMKEEYESLSNVWDILISKKQKYIDISYGDEARKIGNESIELLNKKLQSNIALGIERLNAGASAGSHSIGVRQRKNMSKQGWEELREAANLIGFKYDSVAGGRMTGLFDLTAKQLDELQSKAPTFWAKLDDDVREYLQNIIDCDNEIKKMKEDMKETMTGVSFDSFYDNFVSTLSDMDKSSQDFANDFGEYIKNAILSNLIANKYRQRIEDLYNDWAQKSDSNGDNVFDLTSTEAKELKDAQKSLAEEMIAERDALAKVFGWSSTSTQEASKKGFAQASQDSVDELNGRFTAGQVAWEETKNQSVLQNEKLSILDIKADSLINLASDQKNIADETRTILVNSYMELQQISENTGAIIKPITEMRDKMNSWDSKIRNM